MHLFVGPLRLGPGVCTLETPEKPGHRFEALERLIETGLTGVHFGLHLKAAAETAADRATGRGGVVDVDAGLWGRAVEPRTRKGFDEIRCARDSRVSDYRLCSMLFDNRVEIIGCARRTR